MERRTLVVGLALSLAAPGTALATLARPSTERFRWTPDGRVFRRDGSGWIESIRLARDSRILQIDDTGARTILIAEHAGNQYQLFSTGDDQWRTR